MNHFIARCEERTGAPNAADIYCDLVEALKCPHAYPEYLEFVRTEGDGEYWRFRIAQGIFYAVVIEGRLASCYTQDMVRNKKWAAKQRKRGGDVGVRIGWRGRLE